MINPLETVQELQKLLKIIPEAAEQHDHHEEAENHEQTEEIRENVQEEEDEITLLEDVSNFHVESAPQKKIAGAMEEESLPGKENAHVGF